VKINSEKLYTVAVERIFDILAFHSYEITPHFADSFVDELCAIADVINSGRLVRAVALPDGRIAFSEDTSHIVTFPCPNLVNGLYGFKS